VQRTRLRNLSRARLVFTAHLRIHMLCSTSSTAMLCLRMCSAVGVGIFGLDAALELPFHHPDCTRNTACCQSCQIAGGT
jgi:hypothetical protein